MISQVSDDSGELARMGIVNIMSFGVEGLLAFKSSSTLLTTISGVFELLLKSIKRAFKKIDNIYVSALTLHKAVENLDTDIEAYFAALSRADRTAIYAYLNYQTKESPIVQI